MNRAQKIYFGLMAALFLLTLTGLLNLSHRPGFPFQIIDTSLGLQAMARSPEWQAKLQRGAYLKRLDGQPVQTLAEVQALLERKTIGGSVQMELSDGRHIEVVLQPYYSSLFLLVNALLGLCFFLISGIVWKYARRAGERYFAVSALLFGYIIAVNWPGFQLPFYLSGPVVFLYFLFYPQAFISFLMFCYHFPSPALRREALLFRRRLFSAPGIAFSALLTYLFLKKTLFGDLSFALRYETAYRVFRVFVFATLVLALYVFINNFRKDPNPANRKRFYWMLGGILWGSFPFLFLWNLPLLLGTSPLLPEWLVNLSILIIPVSVAMAIIKYRLFDIEIILSRSIVYALVIAFLFGMYVAVVGAISLMVYQNYSIHSPIPTFITALGIALLFRPLKEKVQGFVNGKFFRIRYDRFQSLQSLMAALDNCSREAAVLSTLDSYFEAIIPTEVAFFTRFDAGKWKFVNFPRRKRIGVNKKLLPPAPLKPLEVFVSPGHLTCFESPQQWSPAELPEPAILAIAVDGSLLWCLGKKRSGLRYWDEDVALALQMARAAALQLEKLKLIRTAMQESLEKEHAQKVNRWKSLLVAEVAHDLRAPLNTMLWKLRNFQDSLSQSPPTAGTPIAEIEKQIQRLQNFIQSLMILSRQEEGKYRPQWQTISVRRALGHTLEDLRGTIEIRQLEIRMRCPENLRLKTDPVLFQEIVQNLLHNAVKFSPPRGIIEIEASRARRRNKEKLCLIIRDQAGGIPREELKSLFEPFAISENSTSPEKGFHLGLFIVREFARLLKGEIVVKSRWKKGTVFTLYFPGLVEKHSSPRTDLKAAE